MRTNTQTAPYPEELEQLVNELEANKVRQNWSYSLDHRDRGDGCEGLTFTIELEHTNSYPPHLKRGTSFLFPVPAATYNRRSWRRWLLDRVADVERHERHEHFVLADGFRPYAPLHGPGNDPYYTYEMSTDEERRTSFLGKIKP